MSTVETCAYSLTTGSPGPEGTSVKKTRAVWIVPVLPLASSTDNVRARMALAGFQAGMIPVRSSGSGPGAVNVTHSPGAKFLAGDPSSGLKFTGKGKAGYWDVRVAR